MLFIYTDNGRYKKVNSLMNSKILIFLLFIVLSLAIPFSFASDDNVELDQTPVLSDSAVPANDVYESPNTNGEVLSDNEIHIYVNASATSEGTGTQDDPYRNLSSLSQIFDYSQRTTVVHIANGRYDYLVDYEGEYFSQLQAITSFKIIGESKENTILDFHDGSIIGITDAFPSPGGQYFYLQDITLHNTSVHAMSYYGGEYIGTLECVNVLFESSASELITEMGLLGGAVSTFCDLKLTNCTFINNTADSGGAFFSISNTIVDNCVFIGNSATQGGAICSGGNTEITNSKFITNDASEEGGAIYTLAPISIKNSVFEDNNALAAAAIYTNINTTSISNTNFTSNRAKSYGGAIVSENGVLLNLTNCIFVNDTARDSAGAIYNKNTTVEIKNSNFTNCTAVFGAAICDLDSESSIFNSNFDSNTAVKGGAIYKVYNDIIIFESNFNDNEAYDGGAIYFDDIYTANITDSVFDSNSASQGSDIYYVGDDDGIFLSNVTTNNVSGVKFINFTTTASDLIYYLINETPVVIEDRYDMRDYGLLTDVKDQKLEGNCWAFASIAALESCVIKANGTVLDLSESNMKNLIASYSDHGSYYSETNMGGNFFTAAGYLASWLGPVYEEVDPYSSNVLSLISNASFHVQDVITLPRSSYTDNDPIKEAILKYGAVVTGMAFDESFIASDNVSYYSYGESPRNHAVTIVGWDDNYSKDLFSKTPAGDGAFIVRNSWGPTWGEDGYFYVSYYDENFAEINNPFDTYTFLLNSTSHYDKNYQHEITMHNAFAFYSDTIYIKNIFVGESDELITAVSTYFGDPVDYELTITINNETKYTQNGTGSYGYHTLPLSKNIPIKEGDVFEIMFKLTTVDGSNMTVNVALASANTRYNSSNRSFFKESLEDEWMDEAADEKVILPIKAFTVYGKLNTTLNVTGLDNNFTINTNYTISASVYDQYGELINDGNITFIVGDENTTVAIKDGVASTTVSFEEAGDYDVSVIYNEDSYYATSNVSDVIEIEPLETALSLSLNTTDLIVGDSVTITANVNTTRGKIYFYVNDVLKEEIDVDEEGNAVLVLENLTYGTYNVTANYTDEKGTYLNSSNKTDFIVNKIEVTLDVDNVTLNYNDDASLDVTVSYDNETLSNITVNINYNNETVTLTTDENGSVSLPLNDWDVASYNVTVSIDNDVFGGEKNITVDVNKAPTTINSEVTDIFNSTAIISFDINTTANVTPEGSVNVTVYKNETVVYNTTVPLNESEFIIPDITEGDYTVDFVYEGNDVLANTTSQLNFTAEDIVTRADNLTKYYGSPDKFEITVYNLNGTIAANKTAVLNINGVNYTRTTNENGTVFLAINLPAGEYNITVTVDNETTNRNVTVLPTIMSEDVVKMFKNGTQYTATFLDAEGNYLPNGTVVEFNINGIFYKRTIKGDNGTATLNINLPAGEYIVTAINNVTGDKCANNIKVLSLITENEDLVKYFKNDSQYVVKILDDNGNPVGAGENVTFNINGQLYNRKTNESGYAKLNINLPQGTYIITANYKGCVVANNITVLSKINTSDLSMKYRDGSKFKATLVDNQGNPLSAGENVTFNINGVFYTRKTNDSGIASLNINLPAGEYIITTAYGGESTSNKITISS